MPENIKAFWSIAFSAITSAITLGVTYGVIRTKVASLTEKDKQREKDLEDLKLKCSNHELEMNHLKERDQEFIEAVRANTEVCNELKVVVAVLSQKIDDKK